MIGKTRSAATADTILVIDDTPESLRLIVDALETHGMTVLIARSGEAALDLLVHAAGDQNMPDLILMDAMMPGMSGLETTQAIKRTQQGAHIPIIFMTGITEPEHVVAAFETGGVDYVRKPIVIDELIARIRVHLTNARRSYRSRLALGKAGRSLVALSPAGDLAWCTPQAEALFKQIEPDWDENSDQLPTAFAPYFRQLLRDADERSALKLEVAGVPVEIAFSESDQPNEVLVKMSEIGEASKVKLLEARSGLTHREAEVLLWVSYGKTNRTISEILGISPRTVNKHLEQIFKKMGVETRAGATALAVRMMEE
jgi:DNA-binding response OmpR family regulator/DNA-binding CsgD family transcriptional regulator